MPNVFGGGERRPLEGEAEGGGGGGNGDVERSDALALMEKSA